MTKSKHYCNSLDSLRSRAQRTISMTRTLFSLLENPANRGSKTKLVCLVALSSKIWSRCSIVSSEVAPLAKIVLERPTSSTKTMIIKEIHFHFQVQGKVSPIVKNLTQTEQEVKFVNSAIASLLFSASWVSHLNKSRLKIWSSQQSNFKWTTLLKPVNKNGNSTNASFSSISKS